MNRDIPAIAHKSPLNFGNWIFGNCRPQLSGLIWLETRGGVAWENVYNKLEASNICFAFFVFAIEIQ